MDKVEKLSDVLYLNSVLLLHEGRETFLKLMKARVTLCSLLQPNYVT